MCDPPFVPGLPMQTDEVDKVLARLQCSHGLAMFLTWKGVMRNCGIRRVVRILLRRGAFFLTEGDFTGKMPKIAGKLVISVHVFLRFFHRDGGHSPMSPLWLRACAVCAMEFR